MTAWRIWVDTGGTFTDCLARDPEGGLRRTKVLSSSCLRLILRPLGGRRLGVDGPPGLPAGFLVGARLRRPGAAETGVEIVAHGGAPPVLEVAAGDSEAWAAGGVGEAVFDEEAPVLAARLATGTARGRSLPHHELRLATTRGTNALLERRGGRVALFVTAGFADLLLLGTQQRSDLFTLRPQRPPPLHEAVVEVPGRLDASGRELEALDLEALAPAAERLLAEGIDGAAIALLHAYRNTEHEKAVALWLAAKGFRNVSRSSALAPRIRLLPRAETAVVDAYLAPVLEGYLTKVSTQGAAARLLVMTSSGGLVPAERFQPKDSLLSGPAGGVVGAAAAGRQAGYDAVLAFDMGGTSTDVSRWAGALDYRFETRIGGARLLAPALRIETVAAGGGSICWFDGSQLKVGPESAAASPGPACYGAGGPLTLTDVNLLLGRLDASRFGLPLDPEASRRRARELAAAVAADSDADIDAMLLGLLRIADERMAEAVRRISVRRGYAPAAHTLVAFGGAGPQHACALAALLGVGTVLVPRDAGLLSALGLGLARREAFAERQVLRRLDEVEDHVESWLGELADEARGRLRDEGETGPFDVRRLAALRLLGQESTLEVEARWETPLDAAFRRAYGELYGYPAQGRPVEVESLRVVVSVETADEAPQPAAPLPREARPTGSQRIRFGAGRVMAATFERAVLAPGSAGSGPALVFEPHCTTVVEPGWEWRVGAAGGLVVER